MAYISYDRATAVHAATPRPRLAWGRILALVFSVAAWAAIIASVRALF